MTFTEKELRLLVREQIISNFEKKKRLLEAKEQVDPEVATAVNSMKALNSQVAAIADDLKSEEPAEGQEKQNESMLLTTAGLLIGLPGLFHVMSKMASLTAKMFNKVGGDFDPEREGQTFHHWADSTKDFYINKILVPVVKKVFKKQIKGNAAKAKVYAEVLYATLLAAVAIHAGIEVVTHGVHAFSSFTGATKTAFEAAHAADAGVSVAGITRGLRAAFTAIGEVEAVAALSATSRAASAAVTATV